MHRKKVALIGWYGKGAHGDDIMEIATKRLFERVAEDKDLLIDWVDEKEADLVVVGGGTILGFDTMGLYGRLKDISVPLVFFGSGVRKKDGKVGFMDRRHIKYLFRKAALKGVRGELSRGFFQDMGIKDVEVLGDPALSFIPRDVNSLPGDFKVGVSIRCMGKTGEKQYADNETNADNIALICEWLAREYGARLFFFDLARNIHDSDREGIDMVMGRMRRLKDHTVIPFETDTPEIFSLLGQMDYIVSQRLHPTILGWAQGVPHAAMEYQFGKTEDFMRTIGMGDLVVRTDKFDLEEYKKMARMIFNERKKLEEDSARRIEELRAKQVLFAEKCLSLKV